MRYVFVVKDRHDSNYRLPYVAIFSDESLAVSLVKQLNNDGLNLAYYEQVQLDIINMRAVIRK